MKNYKLKIRRFEYLVIALVGFLLLSNSYAQEETDVIAKVGAVEIRVEEYKNRFEFMPHPNYSIDTIDTVKKEFLYSLIAEKLWAIEAMDKGLTNSDAFNFYYTPIEKLYIRDESIQD